LLTTSDGVCGGGGGQVTVMVALDVLFAAFESPVAFTVAVLATGMEQSPVVDARLSVIVFDVPEAMVPNVHERLELASVQLAALAPPSVQVPAGSVSASVTLLEGPVPAALMVMVKVAVWPAVSGPLPVFVTEASGWQLTTMDALASAPPSLVLVAVTTLRSVPHCSAVVGLVR
jgi:hypothetical protein